VKSGSAKKAEDSRLNFTELKLRPTGALPGGGGVLVEETFDESSIKR
jgi:hypothetical protein